MCKAVNDNAKELDFTKKELLMSLVCPMLTFIYGAAQIIIYMTTDEGYFKDFFSSWLCVIDLSYFAAVLIGGLLPAAMTCFGKIHTEHFLKQRLVVIAAIALIVTVVSILGPLALIMDLIGVICAVAAIVYQIRNIHCEAFSNGERAVLMLSDPIVYFTIKYAIRLCDDFYSIFSTTLT